MNKQHLIKFLYDSPFVRDKLADRMFPGVARQGSPMPFLAMRQISAMRNYDLLGEDDMAASVLQLSIAAETDAEARQIAEVIRNRLSGYRGMMQSTYVHGCTIESEREQQIRPTTGSDQWLHLQHTDFRITYRQLEPSFT